jgi:DNA-binding SARP family transcriptional activator|tara:strand:+ start:1080 stop:1517 length:438 start_codon:yes stop_codon:yes gene_type:complete
MKQNIKIFLSTFLIIILSNISFANESFFGEGLKLYKDKKYDEAKFLFERSIVFNPKNSNSYLYLAKIYNYKKDEKNEEKNLKSTLLIEPANEEAILMTMRIALKKTNYSKVKDLSERFKKVCKKLCDKSDKILSELANLEPKNES